MIMKLTYDAPHATDIGSFSTGVSAIVHVCNDLLESKDRVLAELIVPPLPRGLEMLRTIHLRLN
jgi:hypothetical protein